MHNIKSVILNNSRFISVKITASVSTWSPLATAFNSPPLKKINFTQNDVGLFNIPELRTCEGFYLLKENVICKTDDLINEAISSTRKRKMVEIFDELSDSLCKVADLAEFIRLAHPMTKYSQAAEDVCVSISGVVEKLNTHKQLYDALKDVVDNDDIFETDEIDNHVAKLFLFDFEQSGIHLPDKQRRKVVRLNDLILQIGQRFMAGAVNPRSISKSILPENIRQYFSAEGDNILISGLYTDSSNLLAREAAYRLFLCPDSKQEELLTDLLKCRHELAITCGFETYAHRALKSSTVETPDMVKKFLNELNTSLKPRSEKDFEIMSLLKAKESGKNIPLAAWDTPYFTAKIKRQWLQTALSEFTPYFSLGACMEGLNNLMKSLYGIALQNVQMQPGESWNSDIYKLAVIHENEGLLGYIYCDLFERAKKPNQDCHFTIQGGKQLSDDGSYQLPIVVVMLNLNQPRWSGPTLLTPSMVDNLFHEMGHAMHSMLARTKYQHVTGTRCSTDFAEVPSVLMEYFASDPRVLRTFAKHFQTQQPIPEEMLQRLCLSKSIFSASETQLQVFYSALDQVYHGDPKLHGETTTDTLKTVQKTYYNLPYVENTAWQLRFSHLVGYGAKYYSYLISRAIASWIWQTYFDKNPLSRDMGEKYRTECLAYGGGIPSRKLVGSFLKRDVTPKNLSDNLITEIDSSNSKLKHLSKILNINCGF